ncbi:MAG: hypothetical protein LBB53_00780 [Prevotellaceae bacterium]|jgi:hypothetical protein|nr:hypothetical protein [Prevotellaceae bacterium]
MNNLIQNYELILKVLQTNCTNIESFKQIKTLKLPNLELAALYYEIVPEFSEMIKSLNYCGIVVENSILNTDKGFGASVCTEHADGGILNLM